MSKSTIRLSYFPSFGLSACETLRTGVTNGFTLSSTLIWWIVFRVPISSKEWWNSEKNVSLFVSILQILCITCKCLLVFNPGMDTEDNKWKFKRDVFMRQSQWARASNWNFGAIVHRQFTIYWLKIWFGR